MTRKQLNQIENITKEMMKNSKDPQHDLNHVLRVEQNALKIIDILNIKQGIDVNLLQAVCLLHDLTYVKYSPSLKTFIFEGILAKNFVGKTIKPLDIAESEKKLILQAISKHPHSYPFRKLNKKGSLYAKILQDADTLDGFNEQRIKNFKSKNRLTQVLSPFIDFFIAYSKKNIQKYLNFPEAANFFFMNQATRNGNFNYKEWGVAINGTILCLHGYADNAFLFKPLAEKIKDRYRVIALSLPMFYEKDKIYSILELADYVETFCKKIKLEQFTIVGFSLGGLRATKYCTKHFDKVESLCLLNSLPQLIMSKTVRKTYKYLKPLLTSKLFLFIFSRISTKNLIRKIVGTFSLTDEAANRMKTNYVSIFGTLFNNLDFSITKEFNKLQIPKTVVLFKDDEALKWKHYKNYARHLKCNLKIFDMGGHASKNCYWENIARLWK